MMSSTAVRLADNEAYAEAMHAILSGEPCRGLVTQPTQLLPHVFIGSQSNAEDLSTMRSLGISHVLNCAGYKGPRPSPNASPYDGLGIDYYEFKAEDSDRYDITRHFGEAFRFLDAAKRCGGVVLVHCALGINRSAAVCVAYLMVERRLALLDATRLIKDRRRIVLANKAFQRQLVRFARTRGLLGQLPRNNQQLNNDDDDDDDGLSGTVRRVALHDRVSDGVDWTLNVSPLDTSASYKSRLARDDWRSATYRSHDSRHDYLNTTSDLGPHRTYLSRGLATRSRETGDVTPTRQYRASKSATSLMPTVSSSSHHSRAPASRPMHNRSSSTSRFSLGFL